MNHDTVTAFISERVYLREQANVDIQLPSGLEARSVQAFDKPDIGFYAEKWEVGGKIVIAIRGTDFAAKYDKLFVGDWFDGNLPLALGSIAAAHYQAAIEIVNSIINSDDPRPIEFTGHSLGGGIAGLLGILYDKPATIFAPAPFNATAQSSAFIPNGMTAEQMELLRNPVVEPRLSEYRDDPLDPGYAAALEK